MFSHCPQARTCWDRVTGKLSQFLLPHHLMKRLVLLDYSTLSIEARQLVQCPLVLSKSAINRMDTQYSKPHTRLLFDVPTPSAFMVALASHCAELARPTTLPSVVEGSVDTLCQNYTSWLIRTDRNSSRTSASHRIPS
jgi:hypothetical protein